MKKNPKKSTRTRPLTFGDIHRWSEAADTRGHDAVEYLKRRRVDPRLLTMSPALAAIVDYLACPYSDARVSHATVMRIANKALGTGYDKQWTYGDGRRVNVLIDWAVRCVLPIWLREAPASCRQSIALSERLSHAQPLMWASEIVAALSSVFAVDQELEQAEDGPITAAELTAIRRVRYPVNTVLELLARALVRQLSNSTIHENDMGLSLHSLQSMSGGMSQKDRPEALATIPRLVDVLCEVHRGDSQGSVANRCQWTSRTKRVA